MKNWMDWWHIRIFMIQNDFARLSMKQEFEKSKHNLQHNFVIFSFVCFKTTTKHDIHVKKRKIAGHHTQQKILQAANEAMVSQHRSCCRIGSQSAQKHDEFKHQVVLNRQQKRKFKTGVSQRKGFECFYTNLCKPRHQVLDAKLDKAILNNQLWKYSIQQINRINQQHKQRICCEI